MKTKKSGSVRRGKRVFNKRKRKSNKKVFVSKKTMCYLSTCENYDIKAHGFCSSQCSAIFQVMEKEQAEKLRIKSQLELLKRREEAKTTKDYLKTLGLSFSKPLSYGLLVVTSKVVGDRTIVSFQYGGNFTASKKDVDTCIVALFGHYMPETLTRVPSFLTMIHRGDPQWAYSVRFIFENKIKEKGEKENEEGNREKIVAEVETTEVATDKK